MAVVGFVLVLEAAVVVVAAVAVLAAAAVAAVVVVDDVVVAVSVVAVALSTGVAGHEMLLNMAPWRLLVKIVYKNKEIQP